MNKIILLLFLIAIALGGFFLFKNTAQYTKNPSYTIVPTVSQPTQTQQQSEPSTTSAEVKEGAMMEKEQSITLTSTGFTPTTLTIKKGTKVVWTNKSTAVATVDSAVHPTHLIYPPLNLGRFNEGEMVSLIFDKEGIYSYHDHLNPSRKGKIVVE